MQWDLPDKVVRRACAANPWFTRADIERAWGAVEGWTEGMNGVGGVSGVKGLNRAEGVKGVSAGQVWSTARRSSVGVVMAGNVPFVGLHDMLCVLKTGNECLYKPSSRDEVLMDWVAGGLREAGYETRRWEGEDVDAVIAMGGDDAMRAIGERFSGVPTLLRGSRSSVAVLTGNETEGELKGLAEDIFAYSGLGCRSVSRLFMPIGYDVRGLMDIFNRYGAPSEGYRNNFLQRRAMLSMQGAEFIEGGFFILREGADFPEYLSEIIYCFDDFDRWFALHRNEVQCVVGREIPFGRAQHPAFTDFPDGVDTLEWLRLNL